MPGEAALCPAFMRCSTAGSTSTSPSTFRSWESVTPPGRRRRGTGVAKVSTVDSTPPSQSPPSKRASTRPVRSSCTWWKVVGLGRPDRLAEGAARGTSAASMTARAVGWEGQRTATVSRPPLVSRGMRSDLGRMMVSGPGQKAAANFLALSGTSCTRGGRWAGLLMWTIRGLSEGRPLAR